MTVAAPVDQPPAEPETGLDGGPAPGRRWRWAVAVLVLVLVVVAAALSRPGGATRADRSEATAEDAFTDQLTPAQPTISQRFTATDDKLSAVDLTFGTFGGQLDCSVRVAVTDDTGATVADSTRSCATLPDTRRIEAARFDPPLRGAAGRPFDMSVTLTEGQAGPVLWGSATSNLPRAQQGGAELPLSVELVSGYDKGARAWNLVPLALTRMHQYGPFWQVPAFVVLDVVAFIGLLVALAVAPRRKVGALLLGLAVAKGLLWAAVLPPLQGPDEPAHVAYAQVLAERHVPLKRNAQDGLPYLSPEIANAVTILHTAAVTGDRPAFDGSGQGPDTGALGSVHDRTSSQMQSNAGYSPAFYLVPAAMEKLPGRIDQRAGYMRLWSIALGAAVVWLSYRIGLRLFPRHPDAATLLALAVAFQPVLSQQTTVVNNDAGLVAGGALCLLVALQLASRATPLTWPAAARPWSTRPGPESQVPGTEGHEGEEGGDRRPPPVAGRRGPAWPLAFWAGVAGGLCWLAKPSGVLMIGVLAVAWLVGRARQAPRARAWWRDVVAALAGLAGTYGVWFGFSVAFGYPSAAYWDTGVSPGPKGLREFVHGLRVDDYFTLRRNWVQEFWGEFSWLQVRLPDWVYRFFVVATLVMLVAVMAWLVVTAVDAARWWARRRQGRPVGPVFPQGGDTAVNTGICLLTVAATMASLFFVMWQYFHVKGRFDLIQGRYALLMLPALLALPALILRRFVPSLSPVAPMAVLVLVLGALQVLSLGVIVNAFYL